MVNAKGIRAAGSSPAATFFLGLRQNSWVDDVEMAGVIGGAWGKGPSGPKVTSPWPPKTAPPQGVYRSAARPAGPTQRLPVA
jgi:hypothetical protein